MKVHPETARRRFERDEYARSPGVVLDCSLADDGEARGLVATMKSVSFRTGRPIDRDIVQE